MEKTKKLYLTLCICEEFGDILRIITNSISKYKTFKYKKFSSDVKLIPDNITLNMYTFPDLNEKTGKNDFYKRKNWFFLLDENDALEQAEQIMVALIDFIKYIKDEKEFTSFNKDSFVLCSKLTAGINIYANYNDLFLVDNAAFLRTLRSEYNVTVLKFKLQNVADYKFVERMITGNPIPVAVFHSAPYYSTHHLSMPAKKELCKSLKISDLSELKNLALCGESEIEIEERTLHKFYLSEDF